MAKREDLDLDDLTEEEIAHFKYEAFQQTTTGTVEVGETLVAEGDSWFDYPIGTDVIDCLRFYHKHRILNHADLGDTLENMIYGTAVNWRFQPKTPTFVRVKRRLKKHKPKVFLFSGGGNDVVGDGFSSFLNHRDFGKPILRTAYVNYMIDEYFRKCLEDLIKKVAKASPRTHIVMHGYGRTAPTGDGVGPKVLTFVGPWLLPALAEKRILDEDEKRETVFTMIERYSCMLANVAKKCRKFHHVNLLDEIDPDKDWANELHLKNSAFRRVADNIHKEIKAVYDATTSQTPPSAAP